jgi:hypothetical protein
MKFKKDFGSCETENRKRLGIQPQCFIPLVLCHKTGLLFRILLGVAIVLSSVTRLLPLITMMMSRSSALVLLFLISCFSATLVRGDFGDYVDTTFTCPATITCLPVCAASVDECPPELRCEGEGLTLCADGSCAAECGEVLVNHCEENACGKNVTCARAILPEPDCVTFFEDWYTNATEGETCVEDEVELLSFTDGGFVAFYVYFAAVLFLIVLYPAFNQRFFPIGETVPLDDFSKESLLSGIALEHKGWTQTSVRKTLLGSFIFFLTSLTLWGIQCLLLVLVVFYYRQQNGEFKPENLNPFQDEVQVLKAFEIVWMVGLAFSLCLKWPPTIESLFLRRCLSAQATAVAVFAPSTAPEVKRSSGSLFLVIQGFMSALFKCISTVFAFIFPDGGRSTTVRGTVEYCPVLVGADGSRSFFFRLRRYVYDDSAGCFVPGVMEVGSKLSDFQDCIAGLSEAEATVRRSRIGHNSIDLKPPNLFFGIVEEFSKVFYIYQNFMTWVRFMM